MIKDILYRVLGFLRALWTRVHTFFSRLGFTKSLALVAAIAVVVIGGLFFLRGSSAPAVTDNSIPTVNVSSVSDLMQGGSSLSVAGTVDSQSQATVNTEKSGQIIALNYALGDYVQAGAVIAQIEDGPELAALQQAQASVDAATAGANVSQTTLAAAQAGAVTALLSAYSNADGTVKGTADSMFANPQSAQPQLLVQSSDSQAKVDAENDRVSLQPVLVREEARSTTLSASDDLASELTKTQTELRQIRDFFDTLVRELNGGIATQSMSQAAIASYQASATAARASITGSISALVSAQQALQTAQQNASQASGTVSASQAGLAQAQAGLAAARANYEKTIIRAPISGTINSLPLKRGNFVQASSPAVTIANNGALEITAYVTQNDAQLFGVGSKVSIDGTAVGVVTRIAPALDPLTKKIEVRIGITGESTLINGQSVSVEIAATPQKSATPSTRITIPLAALKIGADGMSVFTVSASSTLLAQTVSIGELLGDRVVIESGLTATTTIVTDARGLRAGEVVRVK